MKTLVLFWTFLVVMMTTATQAKELQALFSNAAFFSHAEGPYVETYLKIFGPSAEYVITPRGTYQASLQVTMIFKKGDKITDYRKYNLLSAELEDTLNSQPDFIDEQRISLPFGVYELDLSLSDNNSKESPISNTFATTLEFNDSSLKFSDIQLVESFKVTDQANVLSKSGFDLVPYVADFFPPSVQMMNFYTELYNMDKKIGEDQVFLFRYYIESSKDQVVMEDLAKFQRQKSAPVNPLLVSLPVFDLPNGNFNFVVVALDRNNEILATNKIGFYRLNPGIQLDEPDIKAIDITATFAEKISSQDSLIFYLQCLNPIASMRENQYADKILKSNDLKLMQKFLYGFWKTRNDQSPEAEWNSYKMQVLAIEELYKTKVKHGYETDMGYTWLKFGTPDQVDDSRHEPSAVPYVIWHYFHIENQSNVRFVFNNPHLVGTEYFLIFSDARGNRYDDGRGNYDRTSSFGSQGGWGSRFSSNFRR
jgi:GWxTD domain-containing protein